MAIIGRDPGHLFPCDNPQIMDDSCPPHLHGGEPWWSCLFLNELDEGEDWVWGLDQVVPAVLGLDEHNVTTPRPYYVGPADTRSTHCLGLPGCGSSCVLRRSRVGHSQEVLAL